MGSTTHAIFTTRQEKVLHFAADAKTLGFRHHLILRERLVGMQQILSMSHQYHHRH